VGGNALVQTSGGAVASAISSWETEVLQIGGIGIQNRIVEWQVNDYAQVALGADIFTWVCDLSLATGIAIPADLSGCFLNIRSSFNLNWGSYAGNETSAPGLVKSYSYQIQPGDIGIDFTTTFANIANSLNTMEPNFFNLFNAVGSVNGIEITSLQNKLTLVDLVRVNIELTDAGLSQIYLNDQATVAPTHYLTLDVSGATPTTVLFQTAFNGMWDVGPAFSCTAGYFAGGFPNLPGSPQGIAQAASSFNSNGDLRNLIDAALNVRVPAVFAAAGLYLPGSLGSLTTPGPTTVRLELDSAYFAQAVGNTVNFGSQPTVAANRIDNFIPGGGSPSTITGSLIDFAAIPGVGVPADLIGYQIEVRSNYGLNWAAYSGAANSARGAFQSYVYTIQAGDIGANFNITANNIWTSLTGDANFTLVLTAGYFGGSDIFISSGGLTFVDCMRCVVRVLDTLSTPQLTLPFAPGGLAGRLTMDDGSGNVLAIYFGTPRVSTPVATDPVASFQGYIAGGWSNIPGTPLGLCQQTTDNTGIMSSALMVEMLNNANSLSLNYMPAASVFGAVTNPFPPLVKLEYNGAAFAGVAGTLVVVTPVGPVWFGYGTSPLGGFWNTFTQIQAGSSGATVFDTSLLYYNGTPVTLPLLTCGTDWAPAATLPLEAIAIRNALNAAFTLGGLPFIASATGAFITIATTTSQSLISVTLDGQAGTYNLTGAVQGTAGRPAGFYESALGVQSSWAANVAQIEGGNIQYIALASNTPANATVTVSASGEVEQLVMPPVNLDNNIYQYAVVGILLLGGNIGDVRPVMIANPLNTGTPYITRPVITLTTI